MAGITFIRRDQNAESNIVRIVAENTLAEVGTAGYLAGQAHNIARLNEASDLEPFDWQDSDMALIYCSDGHGFFTISADHADFDAFAMSPDVVGAPVTVGNLAVFQSTSGNLEDLGYLPSNAAKTRIVMAGSAVQANYIPHFIDATGTIDDTAANIQNDGNIQAGKSGTAGTLISYPATATEGHLIVAAVNNGSGDFNTTISNASAVGQSQVVSIPDSGAATANFLLDAGAANVLAQQQFVGIPDVLLFGTGTWTTTRIAEGNYVKRHTPTDETSIIGIDITPMIRTAASKGFRLDSFDYIYSIGVAAMDAHTVTLDKIAYANNVAVAVTSVPLTGSLATATQANPYASNIAVTTPAFDNTADSKYVLEVTANNSATSTYDFYGVVLKFSQTIG